MDKTDIEKDAARWRYFADCSQTAYMLGTELDPNADEDWLLESNRLADLLMVPNAKLSRGETQNAKTDAA